IERRFGIGSLFRPDAMTPVNFLYCFLISYAFCERQRWFPLGYALLGSVSLPQRKGDCTNHHKQKQVTRTSKLDQWSHGSSLSPPLDYSGLAGIRERRKKPSGGKASSACFKRRCDVRRLCGYRVHCVKSGAA